MHSRPILLMLFLLAVALVRSSHAASIGDLPDTAAYQTKLARTAPESPATDIQIAPATTDSALNSRDSSTAAAPQLPIPMQTLLYKGSNIELTEELWYRDSSRLGVIRDRDQTSMEIANPFESGARDLRRGFIFLGAGAQAIILTVSLMVAVEPDSPPEIIVPLIPGTGLLIVSTLFLNRDIVKKTKHLARERYHAQ